MSNHMKLAAALADRMGERATWTEPWAPDDTTVYEGVLVDVKRDESGAPFGWVAIESDSPPRGIRKVWVKVEDVTVVPA